MRPWDEMLWQARAVLSAQGQPELTVNGLERFHQQGDGCAFIRFRKMQERLCKKDSEEAGTSDIGATMEGG